MKAILCKLICGVLLAAMLIVAVSCGKKKENPANTSTDVSTETKSGSETETKAPNNIADVPEDLDFGGKVFTIRSSVQSDIAGHEFDPAMDGSIVDTAVYKRNDALETRYNCIIENREEGTTDTAVMLVQAQQLINGNSTEYQILVTASFRMTPLAINGYLADICKIDAIDLDKDYYSQGYNNALSVGDSQYLVTGKMTISYYRYMLPMFFNRDLFSRYNLDAPYQAVLNQEWTWENAQEMLKDMYADDDDIAGPSVGDTYGFYLFSGGLSSQTDSFMSACNLTVVSKTDDNYYQLDINTQRFSDCFDKVKILINSETTYSSGANGFNNLTVLNHFVDGKVGLMSYRMFCVEQSSMRNMSSGGKGYGILPTPKADLNQEDYVSYVQDQCFLFGFIDTLKGEELQQVGQFFEVYSAESYNVVRPAYYERALTTRYVNDPESVKMIEIIDTNTFVDPVNVYLTSAFSVNTTTFREVYNPASDVTVEGLLIKYVTGKDSVLATQVDDLNATFRELANKSENSGNS